jgi:sucrose synthase
LLFEDKGKDILGHLKDTNKPSIFSMARLDKIKNITGLVEAYAKSRPLQKKANLIIVAGTLNEEEAQDREEIQEIKKMYGLIKKYKLDGKIRWLSQKPKKDTGEFYRLIADKKGVFVQPALYEAFGLTILEAMHCGLTTFATQFGGPQETIEAGVSGYLINPTRPELISEPLLAFFSQCEKNPEYWKKISDAGIQRAQTSYTWKLYSQNLLKLSKIYGFWKYTASAEGKRDMIRYCDVIYYLLLHKRAEALLDK